VRGGGGGVRREPLKYIFLSSLAFLLLVEVYLLLSGNRILLDEDYYPEREASAGSIYVPASEAKFGCTYFTGRRQVYEDLSSYEYDECPFIWTEG
jgi:hypothetical protein